MQSFVSNQDLRIGDCPGAAVRQPAHQVRLQKSSV